MKIQIFKTSAVVIAVITIFINSSFSQSKKLCVTIDDLPIVSYSMNTQDHLWKITKGLVDTCKKFDVPAIGYVNESKLYLDNRLDSSRYQMLEYWLENDLDLGNHTFSHMNYHKSGFDDFTVDLLKGEQVTRPLCLKYGKRLKYFRHPYLRSGSSKPSADSLLRFLDQHNYIEAPVTTDNDEYLYAHAFHLAFVAEDAILQDSIGWSYINYMEEKLKYFERLSLAVFDREIAQTLLIHANLLNAIWSDELYKMYESHGYNFVSQEEILKDPAYQEEVTKFGDWGISWLDRWALSKEKGKHLFKEDPAVPEFIHKVRKR